MNGYLLSKNQTGKNMKKAFITIVESPAHQKAGHPEHPDRFELIMDWIKNPPYSEIKLINTTPALHEDVLRVHSSEMLLSLKIACELGLQDIEPAPTYVNSNSYSAIMDAAGGVLSLARLIWSSKKAFPGFAIIRPPGHHADRDKPMGFCLLNNTAIGVMDVLEKGCEKVAIIDFDGHHANGTQAIFFNEPRVGLFSMQQENIYPGSGNLHEQVKGRIINLPLPANTDDMALGTIIERLLKPWILKFKPEMIFVSAGFDGHFSDPITGLGWSTTSYFSLAKAINNLSEIVCKSKLLFVLEGGYDPLALKEGILSVLCALIGRDCFEDSYGTNPYFGESLESVISLLVHYHGL